MAFPNRIHLLQVRQPKDISDSQRKTVVRRLNSLDQKAQIIFSAENVLDEGSEAVRIYFAYDSLIHISDLNGVDVNHTSVAIGARHPLIPYELCGVSDTIAGCSVAKILRFDADDFRLPVGYTLAVCISPLDAPHSEFSEFELGYKRQISIREFKIKIKALFAHLKMPNLLDLSWVNQDCSISFDNTTIFGRNDDYIVIVRQDYFY